MMSAQLVTVKMGTFDVVPCTHNVRIAFMSRMRVHQRQTVSAHRNGISQATLFYSLLHAALSSLQSSLSSIRAVHHPWGWRSLICWVRLILEPGIVVRNAKC